MHCKAAGHSVAIFGLLAKTQSTCLLRVLFARRLWSDANHDPLQAKATYAGEQCSSLLSPADPQNSLRQKPCRRTCGGDRCCATPRATVSSLVARSERTSARRARAAKRAGAAPIPAARSAMPRSILSTSLPERLAAMRLGKSLQAKATYRESNALPYLYLQAFDA